MFQAAQGHTPRSTRVEVVSDGIVICTGTGARKLCGPDCISRSQLLQDAVTNSEPGETAQIPLKEEPLLLWMATVWLCVTCYAFCIRDDAVGGYPRSGRESQCKSASRHLRLRCPTAEICSIVITNEFTSNWYGAGHKHYIQDGLG